MREREKEWREKKKREEWEMEMEEEWSCKWNSAHLKKKQLVAKSEKRLKYPVVVQFADEIELDEKREGWK